MKIKLVDSVMGSGKTTGILNEIYKWYEEGKYSQFCIVSPNLSEVGGERVGNKFIEGRVQRELPDLNFKFPIPKKGSKHNHVVEMFLEGRNIATTHSLFTNITPKDVQCIADNKNVLVIDEAVNAVQHVNTVSKDATKSLISSGWMKVVDGNRLVWDEEICPVSNPKTFEFGDLYNMCLNGTLYLLDNQLFIWEFPLSVLEAFDEVYVLTYLFEGSVMSSWCKYHNVEVEDVTDKLNLLPEKQIKDKVRALVNLLDSKASRKMENHAFSQAWWQQSFKGDVAQSTKTMLTSLCTNDLKSYVVKDILITCPKKNWYTKDPDTGVSYKSVKLKGKGYTRATWLASTCRATNDYADKRVVFYLLNKYPHVMCQKFCAERGYSIDRDMYALAEMLQFLWRGCIRKDEPMVIFIANKRMKDLFKAWLGS